MGVRTREIPLFLGTSTAVDKKNIEPFQSQKELNCRHEDGRLAAPWGYKNLAAAQANFSAAYGIVYLQGYDSSNNVVEEYISFEHLGASVGAYTRDSASLAVGSIITGATGLHASDWVGFSFDDKSYLINPNHTTDVYRHVIGDATSWVGLAHPPDPTTRLTYRIDFASGGGAQYATLAWTGTDAADITVTGTATTTGFALTAGELRLRHSASGTGAASFEVDLNAITAGVQDWSKNDIIAVPLVTPSSGVFQINPSSIKVTLTNNDGTPKILVPTKIDITSVASNMHVARCYFANKTRADWDNIRKLKVEYQVTAASGTATNNVLTVPPPVIGCCWMVSSDPAGERLPGRGHFGYAYRVDSTALNSGIAGDVEIPNAQLRGLSHWPGVEGLGCWITFTHAASGSADKVRYYWEGPDGKWHLLTTQDDATTTFLLQMDYQEMLAAEVFTAGPFLTSPIVNAFAFKEWVIWCYGTGESNVRHSRVGDPEAQYSQLDRADDENRGANFTLAEGFADSPLGGIQAGDSAILFGLNGVYEQTGDRPSQMSPCKRLGSSFGAASKFAFCRFKDDQGHPGAAFVDRHGSGIYFAYPSGINDPEAEGRIVELSIGIRGKLFEFLLTEQGYSSVPSALQLYTDDAQDALHILLGKREIILRRPNTATGEREWEFRDYNLGASGVTISRVAASTKRRVRWMRSNGKCDESQWNTADSMWIGGVNRDGGNPMPQGYWRSKAHSGQSRRVKRIYLERTNPLDLAEVRVITKRLNQKYRIEPNRNFASCLPLQQGFDIEFEVIVPEMDGAYTRLFWDEVEAARRVSVL